MKELSASVLDLVPVRSGQTSAQAIAASLALAEIADRLGYARYWFAEHHNMPAVASTTPPVLIAAAATRTERIRLGSGGIMLPNHAPLIVAEQFAALEAIAPGRIDLGLGRAPGSDPVITQLLHQSGATSDVSRFPDHITDILALASAAGATLRFTSGGTYDVHATPNASSVPEVWILGSSDYSAQLAARFGLPYVFANHFGAGGIDRALELYRSQFEPSETLTAPRTFVTVNVSAAATAEEAHERALPSLRQFARIRTNAKMRAVESVDEALSAAPDERVESLVADGRTRWLIGTGAEVATGLRELATRYDVDEVMISPNAGDYSRESLDGAAGRVATLGLIAEHLRIR